MNEERKAQLLGAFDDFIDGLRELRADIAQDKVGEAKAALQEVLACVAEFQTVLDEVTPS